MEKKTVSVRLTDKQKATLRQHFGTTSAGAGAVADIAAKMDGLLEIFGNGEAALTWAVTAIPTFLHQTWAEISGGFSKSDLILIAQAMAKSEDPPNGGVCIKKINEVIESCRTLRPKEGQAMENAHKTILLKISKLSLFQRVALECWAMMFWQDRTRRNSSHDDRFVSLMGV